MTVSTSLLACLIGFASCSSPQASESRTPQSPITSVPVDPNPNFLRQYAETNRFRSGRPGSFAISPDGGTVCFLRSGPRDRVQSLFTFDTKSGTEREFLSAPKLLGAGEENLSPEEKARRERARQTARGIASFQLSKDGKSLLVPLSGRLFIVSASDASVRELKPGVENAPPPLDPRFSPDATKVAFVRAGDLWVADIASGTETRLTTGATETLTHGDAEFIAQEEMGRSRGYWWSPDSKMLVYQTTDTSMVEEVFIADPLRPFVPPQSWRYPRAGKKNAVVTLSAVGLDGKDAKPLNWDRESFPYLATVKWEKQRGVYVVVQNRLQTESRMLRFDPRTWESQLLLTETDPAWVNLDQEMPAFSDDLPGFFWTTEGAGWTDLEWRMEGPSSSAKRLVAGGELNVRSLVKVDVSRRETLVTASAVPNSTTGAPVPEPTQTHLYSIEYRDGDPAPRCLTCEWPGVHGATVSEDGSTIVLSTTPERGAPSATVYRRAEGERGLGTRVGEVTSNAEAPLSAPNVEWTTVKGTAIWHAAILRPANFRKGQKLPVICSVYTGPTAQTVTRAGWSYALQQWIADHGFIVVSIDNRGTPGRGRDWERLTHGNLIDLQLNDQAAALAALGEQYPEMDMKRVGVYGWSFGGYYAAMAACRRPDVYKAACAGAPVTDWADYDTCYTERYLGLPEVNVEGYRIGNVMTWVKDLRTPLLLIHGSADDNVYFTHSLKLMDEAVRRGTSNWIDFMPLAGQTHVVVEPEVVERMYARMVQFFAENL
jgi:dipeptidyl-peptidase-4